MAESVRSFGPNTFESGLLWKSLQSANELPQSRLYPDKARRGPVILKCERSCNASKKGTKLDQRTQHFYQEKCKSWVSLGNELHCDAFFVVYDRRAGILDILLTCWMLPSTGLFCKHCRHFDISTCFGGVFWRTISLTCRLFSMHQFQHRFTQFFMACSTFCVQTPHRYAQLNLGHIFLDRLANYYQNCPHNF